MHFGSVRAGSDLAETTGRGSEGACRPLIPDERPADRRADRRARAGSRNPCRAVSCPGLFLSCRQDRNQTRSTTLRRHQAIEIVAEQEGKYAAETARAALQNILQAHRDVDVVATTGDQMAFGMEQAIKAAGLQGKVKIIGNGASAVGVSAVKAGRWHATVVLLPCTEGRVATEYVVRAARGATGLPTSVDVERLSRSAPWRRRPRLTASSRVEGLAETREAAPACLRVMSVSSQPHAELRAIGKRFGGVVASGGSRWRFTAARYTRLVGENGAGKSTLGKDRSGRLQPDEARSSSPGAKSCTARRARRSRTVTFIAQERLLVETRSVIENVFLGVEPAWRSIVDRRRLRARYAALRERTGFDLPPHAGVRDLRAADRQKVEVMRALARRGPL